MSLDEIALKYNTDKCSNWHNYTLYYDSILNKRKDELTSILELGVLRGNSLKMWSEYAPNANVAGVDLNPDAERNYGEKIKVFIGSQTSRKTLDAAINFLGGNIDIVIDDAAHINTLMIATFDYLFPKLKPGGIYFMEDTVCMNEIALSNSFSLLEDFIIRMNRDIHSNYRILGKKNCADFKKVDIDNIMSYTERWVEKIEVTRGIISIFKRQN